MKIWNTWRGLASVIDKERPRTWSLGLGDTGLSLCTAPGSLYDALWGATDLNETPFPSSRS